MYSIPRRPNISPLIFFTPYMDGTLPFRTLSFSIFQHVGLRFLHGHASVSSYYVLSCPFHTEVLFIYICCSAFARLNLVSSPLTPVSVVIFCYAGFNGLVVFCHIVVFQFEPTHKSNLENCHFRQVCFLKSLCRYCVVDTWFHT